MFSGLAIDLVLSVDCVGGLGNPFATMISIDHCISGGAEDGPGVIAPLLAFSVIEAEPDGSSVSERLGTSK